MNRKTQAQRDAINARADAYPRPISPSQRLALVAMAAAPLRFWRLPGQQRWAWGGFFTATINSLEQRRLCRIRGKQRPRAVITAVGRRELARHRGVR